MFRSIYYYVWARLLLLLCVLFIWKSRMQFSFSLKSVPYYCQTWVKFSLFTGHSSWWRWKEVDFQNALPQMRAYYMYFRWKKGKGNFFLKKIDNLNIQAFRQILLACISVFTVVWSSFRTLHWSQKMCSSPHWVAETSFANVFRGSKPRPNET